MRVQSTPPPVGLIIVYFLFLLITFYFFIFSLTFNKIKDDVASIETSSKAPWWMAFTKVTETTTISTTEKTSTTILATPEKPHDAQNIPVNYNTVKFEPVPSLTVSNIASKPQLQQPHSSNTIGKLINVTGDN